LEKRPAKYGHPFSSDEGTVAAKEIMIVDEHRF
jgi:hypothetical protein